MNDMVYHPQHYVGQSVMIEPIDILRFAPFDLGNALKYVIRAGHKDDELQDLKKAEVYLEWALDTYTVLPEPYDAFMNHYGMILEKFEAITREIVWDDAYDFIRGLLERVRGRIVKVQK